jgi:predicted permease
VAIKILVLPAVGLLLFWLFKIDKTEFLPGLILLATPTATVSYVMAKEMHGDADFAVAAISLSTLLSAATYIFWLTVVSA